MDNLIIVWTTSAIVWVHICRCYLLWSCCPGDFEIDPDISPLYQKNQNQYFNMLEEVNSFIKHPKKNMKSEVWHRWSSPMQWINLGMNQAVMSDLSAINGWVTGTYRKQQWVLTSLSICCNYVTMCSLDRNGMSVTQSHDCSTVKWTTLTQNQVFVLSVDLVKIKINK